MSDSVSKLKSQLYDADAIGAALAIMAWDQQTYMPSGSAGARGEHMALLHKMYHELMTSDEHGKALEEAAKTAEGQDAALVRVAK